MGASSDNKPRRRTRSEEVYAFWEQRLSPWDRATLRRVEWFTGHECRPHNGGDHYFFEMDYTENDTDGGRRNLRVFVEVMLGERVISVEDRPERRSLLVKVRFKDAGDK